MMSSRVNNTHWCYNCRLAVQVTDGTALCPICECGFVLELDDMAGFGALDLFRPGGRQVSDDTGFGIMDAFVAYMRQRLDRENQSYEIGNPHTLLFGGNIPVSQNDRFESFLASGPTHLPNYMMGSGLEELLEQLSGNERRGPPPAARSSIEAMPTVRIAAKHLRSDSHCPICKDVFELGAEVRQMPCKHMYHSNCIVPWLVQHISCPVCRHEHLPTAVWPTGSGGGQASGQGRWNPFSMFWPFGSANTGRRGSEPPSPSRGGSGSGGGHIWPFN